jgi:hypothetical protein
MNGKYVERDNISASKADEMLNLFEKKYTYKFLLFLILIDIELLLDDGLKASIGMKSKWLTIGICLKD